MERKNRAAIIATAILQIRRSRSNYLPSEFFAEPAWDLLLELFVCDAIGAPLTARIVSEKSKFSPSIMSRWLEIVSDRGLIVGDGSGDIDDEITLSGTGFEAVERIMLEVQQLADMIA